MTLRDRNSPHGAAPLAEHKSLILFMELKHGADYELKFDYTTQAVHLAKDSLHMTLMIAKESYYRDQY